MVSLKKKREAMSMNERKAALLNIRFREREPVEKRDSDNLLELPIEQEDAPEQNVQNRVDKIKKKYPNLFGDIDDVNDLNISSGLKLQLRRHLLS